MEVSNVNQGPLFFQSVAVLVGGVGVSVVAPAGEASAAVVRPLEEVVGLCLFSNRSRRPGQEAEHLLQRLPLLLHRPLEVAGADLEPRRLKSHKMEILKDLHRRRLHLPAVALPVLGILSNSPMVGWY